MALSELGTAQVRYSEQSLQSLLQSAASVDKLFDALEVGDMFTELSLVRAGAAGAERMAVPHRCGVEAGGRRERLRRESRAERRTRRGWFRPCVTESRGDGDGLEGCLVQAP